MHMYRYLGTLMMLLPFAAYAQQPRDFRGLVGIFLDIIGVLIPLIFALTFVVLIWGIVKAWIINAGDEAEIQKGKRLVGIGIVVLVIMSGIWGILELLQRSIFG